jgi:4-aminobutyrate aminotransferase/(S)-3-amino-2-methylpropionate transaminase
MDAAQPGGLGGTFGGNPVAAAAAIAVFEQIEQQDLLAAGRRIEARLRPALEALAEEFDVIGDVRGRGAMLAIELVEPGTRGTTKTPNAAAVRRIADYAAQQGVLVLTAGTWANVIRFLPSLVITDEQLDDAVAVLRGAIAAL